MQTTITWAGIAYDSIEHCVVTKTTTGYEITAAITGIHENKNYQVDYSIHTNLYWELEWMDLQTVVDDITTIMKVEKKNDGLSLQGNPGTVFNGTHDVDISLTPFTNTLHIQRLGLQDGDQQVIEVMYFDILAGEIRPVMQVYTRLSAHEYIYANFDKSFTATITVNEQGLVTNYPELFTMTEFSIGTP